MDDRYPIAQLGKAYPTMILGDIAKAEGMSKIAREANLGRESLYKALPPGSKPRFDTIL